MSRMCSRRTSMIREVQKSCYSRPASTDAYAYSKATTPAGSTHLRPALHFLHQITNGGRPDSLLRSCSINRSRRGLQGAYEDLAGTEFQKMYDNRTMLITEVTGAFGVRLVEQLLQRFKPRKVIIFS